MKRCTKCVLPSTMPNINFDDMGICNYCHTYNNFTYQGEKKLNEILDRHRSKGRSYDCMVAISGGRDSAYTLLKVVKDYKMKALAVDYENPFTDPQAIVNIRNMIHELGVDIVRFKHMSNIHENCFRNNLIAWLKKPSPAMVPMMCIGCKIIWNKIIAIAKRYGISLIINGGNPFEYTSYKKELLNVSRDAELHSYYKKFLPGLIHNTMNNVNYLKPKYFPVLIKGYLFSNQYALGSNILGRGIEKIDLFHFIKWHENEVVSRITNELGWDYPRANKSTWRFDCKIGHLKDYMYMKTVGFTEKDDFYAKMIREGEITREEALRRLNIENQIRHEMISSIFQQINIYDGIL